MTRILNKGVNCDKWKEMMPKVWKQAKLESTSSTRVFKALEDLTIQGV